MVQAKQVAVRGAIQTDELLATVQTMSRQRNMVNVNKARAAALKTLKKTKDQLVAEAASGDSADNLGEQSSL